MVEEYAKSVMQLLKKTINNREGMKRVVDTTEETLTKIDQDIAELLIQRKSLVTVHGQYISLYKVILDEELRTRQEVTEVEGLPMGAGVIERARQYILNYVEESGSRYVKDSEIINQMRADAVTIPWKNPKAVIATILLRTGRWQKKEPGVYEIKEELQL